MFKYVLQQYSLLLSIYGKFVLFPVLAYNSANIQMHIIVNSGFCVAIYLLGFYVVY